MTEEDGHKKDEDGFPVHDGSVQKCRKCKFEREMKLVQESKCDECGRSCGNHYNLAVHQGATGHKQKAPEAVEALGAGS